MNTLPTTIIGVLISVGLLFIPNTQSEAPSPIIANIEEEQKEAQRPDALDRWITKLAFCESSNRPEAINQFDGGSPSYGYLQWKLKSFWLYNQKYKILPDLERDEVRNIIMDREVQIELARRVLLEEANGRGWRNWWYCSQKAGLAELEKIRSYYEIHKRIF